MMKHLKLKPGELNDILNSFGRSDKSTKFLQRKIETTKSKTLFFSQYPQTTKSRYEPLGFASPENPDPSFDRD